MAVIMLGFNVVDVRRGRDQEVGHSGPGSAVVFAGALWLVRSQETVQDVSFMRAMIPHPFPHRHPDQRAGGTGGDPRVRDLGGGGGGG